MLFIWFTHDERQQGLLRNLTQDVSDTTTFKTKNSILATNISKQIPRSDKNA